LISLRVGKRLKRLTCKSVGTERGESELNKEYIGVCPGKGSIRCTPASFK